MGAERDSCETERLRCADCSGVKGKRDVCIGEQRTKNKSALCCSLKVLAYGNCDGKGGKGLGVLSNRGLKY